jgi:hypothetical protein
MDGKYANRTAPKPPRCHSCAKPMQLLRRTSRFDGCLISTPSTASHVMSGTLRRGAPSSSRNCMPELANSERMAVSVRE